MKNVYFIQFCGKNSKVRYILNVKRRMYVENLKIYVSKEIIKNLKNINLKLENDKFYVITGPNGSGKSTLAKIIMGINKQDSGQVILDGKDINNLPINERANIELALHFNNQLSLKELQYMI